MKNTKISQHLKHNISKECGVYKTKTYTIQAHLDPQVLQVSEESKTVLMKPSTMDKLLTERCKVTVD